MYQYSERDRQFLRERVLRFRDQLRRRLDGRLSEDQFRPLRLQHGLYQEKHAPMLRVAIPYGELNSRQLRSLADVAETYDRGYGHFTTRQNIQFNWPAVDQVGDIFEQLAKVDVHAVQTSGNVIRNITTDFMAGVAADEYVDPRPYCELIRQWSADHPEFSWLPRKFKIAVSGAAEDRAAIRVHDIGLRLTRNDQGQVRVAVWVGGGLGRTPVLARCVREDLDPRDLLSYLEAILRVYNLEARRDNLYKSRIKILLQDLGIERFRALVEQAWEGIRDGELRLSAIAITALAERFDDPVLIPLAPSVQAAAPTSSAPEFQAWCKHNVQAHRVTGYAVALITLKGAGRSPGDMRADEMRAVATLAERFSQGRIRTTQTQNLALPYVRRDNLLRLWHALRASGLAEANHGLATDMVCCPGADYCSLASAGTLAIAAAIRQQIQTLGLDEAMGLLRINLSGCVNACGHHHIGDIGLLGVSKNGNDWYQITLGGRGGDQASIGRRLGPALPADQVAAAIASLLQTYLACRDEAEPFSATLDRIGLEKFREKVYATVTPRKPAIEAVAAFA